MMPVYKYKSMVKEFPFIKEISHPKDLIAIRVRRVDDTLLNNINCNTQYYIVNSNTVKHVNFSDFNLITGHYDFVVSQDKKGLLTVYKARRVNGKIYFSNSKGNTFNTSCEKYWTI